MRLLSLLRSLPHDGRVLFTTRMVRMFAFGAASIVLVLYLAQLGLDQRQIGVLLTLTLLGDAAISLWITTHADRIGRRRMLMIGAALMLAAGVLFGATSHLLLLTFAAIIGTISPSGNEVGPFLSIEQAALTHTTSDSSRTRVFAWYNLAGLLATALGALLGGGLVQGLQGAGFSVVDSFRAIFMLYAALGIVLVIDYRSLTPAVEVNNPDFSAPSRFGLTESRAVVIKLSGLFLLDAFAGGLVVQSLLVYWFYVRFGVDIAALGAIFFATNVLAGLSALAAARLAARFGLINTMVFTHLPSNILLVLVPLMLTLPLAILVLLLRFSISQMDVPTRQSYVMAVVAPGERSAAAGITNIARTVGAMCAPVLAGALLNAGWLSVPFFISGGLKIVYDIALYRSYRTLKPPEESGTRG
jgi:MFS family permease